MPAPKKTRPMPPRLFVTREQDGDSEYYLTHVSIEGIDADETFVGIYELTKTGHVSVQKTLAGLEDAP